MNRKYRVVRLEDRSYYGHVPVTGWLDYNDAQAQLRYYNVKRVGQFDVQCQTLCATLSSHSEGR